MILKTVEKQLDTNNKVTTWYDGIQSVTQCIEKIDGQTYKMLYMSFEGERSDIGLPVREKMYLCNNNGKTIETIYPVER